MKLNHLELNERIHRNYQRLCEPYYQIDEVFADPAYDWPGDKEGRALLAFVCHYQMTGAKVPCMEPMIAALPEKTNRFGFFGHEAGEIIDEQQLSGHSWYLRGLLAYYEAFKDEAVLALARSTVENLFLPTAGRYAGYPIERGGSEGGVSGCRIDETLDGWQLSTDVGCAFMSFDGLSHYYEVTGDARVLALLEEMREVFDGIDKMYIKAQTHCCLTAARSFLRLYRKTGEEKWLQSSQKVAKLYVDHGMTYTYQNYNWWNKGNTWTEPCAVVDSLMLFGDLYELTGCEECRRLAVRIWHNGFATVQRGNGGAGTCTTVNSEIQVSQTKMYEAYFCCTMRLAEGLLYAQTHADLLTAEEGALHKDEKGRYMAGDILYAEVTFVKDVEAQANAAISDACAELPIEIDRSGEVAMDGYRLMPMVKYYNLPKEITDCVRQRIVFE